jgi:hypothetical protein
MGAIFGSSVGAVSSKSLERTPGSKTDPSSVIPQLSEVHSLKITLAMRVDCFGGNGHAAEGIQVIDLCVEFQGRTDGCHEYVTPSSERPEFDRYSPGAALPNKYFRIKEIFILCGSS